MHIANNLPRGSIWYARYVKILFLSSHMVVALLFLIIEKIIPRSKRVILWRYGGYYLVRLFFMLARIQVRVPAKLFHPHDGPVVYVSNHPSMLDGFMYYSLLGPSVMPLTQPADSLMFPFNIWFKKMKLVDVKRDDYDEHTSKTAQSKKDALDELVRILKEEKKSVLIFPEGHAEKKHQLEYIHTGALRVAIRAQVPIVVCTVSGFEKVYIDEHTMRPGTLHINVSEPMFPPKVTKQVPFRKVVKYFSEEFRTRFMRCLSSKYIPDYIADVQKGVDPAHIGIFVDIDNTVYKGYSQQHFVKYMMKHGELSKFTMLRIFRHILLEKIGVISHDVLMERAFAFTKGWREEDMEHVATKFFEAEVVPHLFHDMLPPLNDHYKAGHTIVFVTEVIQPLAKQFKTYFHAKDAVGSLIETKNGVYIGKIKRLCKGDEKLKQARRIAKKHDIDLTKSYAYGDSCTDIPMLSCVRYPCAVQPVTKLKNYAYTHHWEIIG